MTRRAAAYWVYDLHDYAGRLWQSGPSRLLCPPCWQQSMLPGQVQWAEDLAPGECCAACGKLLA